MHRRRAMSARHYKLSLNDEAGELDFKTFQTFREAMLQARLWKFKYPRKVLTLYNLNNCDYNHTGLSEEEQEEFDALGGRSPGHESTK
jgi:hypothetical protein